MWVFAIVVLGTLAMALGAVMVRRANNHPRRGVG